MKTVTIPDPAEVEAILQAEYPKALIVGASFTARGWSMFALRRGTQSDPSGHGATPEEALEDLRAKLKESDPIERLRREADALNLQLIPKP